jgi:hypothetical protein
MGIIEKSISYALRNGRRSRHDEVLTVKKTKAFGWNRRLLNLGLLSLALLLHFPDWIRVRL